jgi:hypothetical protein
MRKTRSSKKEPRELILSSDDSEREIPAKKTKVLKATNSKSGSRRKGKKLLESS